MKRSELSELHYITTISNVSSIMKHGILCHRVAQKVRHDSIAMNEIQNKRSKIKVPGGLPLHDYSNLYLCARNPMLFMRKNQHMDLCVLRVSTDVLDLHMVVITDGNAASDYTGFWSSPAGLSKVDKDLVFAEFWTDGNNITKLKKKRAKCAEVLVPDLVEPRFILGAYVSCNEVLRKLKEIEPTLDVNIDRYLFFK